MRTHRRGLAASTKTRHVMKLGLMVLSIMVPSMMGVAACERPMPSPEPPNAAMEAEPVASEREAEESTSEGEAEANVQEAPPVRPGLEPSSSVQPLRGIKLSPDGRLLASCREIRGVSDPDPRAELHLWDVQTRQRLRTFSADLSGWACKEMAFSPDGTTLAVSDGSSVVMVDVAADGASRKFHTDGAGQIISLAFSPDGKSVAQGNWNTNHDKWGVVVWDVASGRATLRDGATWVAYDLAFQDDQRLWIHDSGNKETRLLEVESDQILRTLPKEVTAKGAILGPQAKTYVTCEKGSATLRSLEETAEPLDLKTSCYATYSIDGKALIAMREKLLRVVDVTSGRELHKLDVSGMRLRQRNHSIKTANYYVMELGPGGETVAIAGKNGVLKWWNLETGEHFSMVAGDGEWLSYGPEGRIEGSPNGDDLVSADDGAEGP